MVSFMSLYFPPVFRLIKKRSIVQTSPSFSFSFSFLSPPVSSLVLLTFSLQKYIYIYIHSVYPSSITTTCSGFFGSILVPKGDGEMEATQSLRSEWIIAYNL